MCLSYVGFGNRSSWQRIVESSVLSLHLMLMVVVVVVVVVVMMMVRFPNPGTLLRPGF